MILVEEPVLVEDVVDIDVDVMEEVVVRLVVLEVDVVDVAPGGSKQPAVPVPAFMKLSKLTVV